MTQTRRTTMAEPIISSAHVDAYHSDGFVLIEGLFDPDEAHALRTAGHSIIDRLARQHEVEATWESAELVDAGASAGAESTSLKHCHDVQFQSALFSRYLTDPRLIDAAAALMGTPNVQLHHNKLFIKPPSNGSPFPLHQDWPFFPHAQNSPMAVIMHLDDAGPEKGCLRVVSGSHHEGRIEHVGGRQWHLPIDTHPLSHADAVPARAGDALFFGCLTVHGSGVNVSDEARTTWLLQLRNATDTPTVDRHRSPGQGMMLGGDNVGDAPPPSVL